MKTLCIKIGSGLLLAASLALLIFVVKMNVVERFEERVSREDVLEWVGDAISHTLLREEIVYAKELGEIETKSQTSPCSDNIQDKKTNGDLDANSELNHRSLALDGNNFLRNKTMICSKMNPNQPDKSSILNTINFTNDKFLEIAYFQFLPPL